MIAMIRLIVFMFKLTVLAFVVLTIGLVDWEGKRLTDRVEELTHSEAVQTPIKWITEKVDFTGLSNGSAGRVAEKLRKQSSKILPAPEHYELSESETDEFSAVLKRVTR